MSTLPFPSLCIANLASNRKYKNQDPEASLYKLKSLKEFIRNFACIIDVEEGINVPGSETVPKHWNAFTAAWQREHPEKPVPWGIAMSITQACTRISPISLWLFYSNRLGILQAGPNLDLYSG